MTGRRPPSRSAFSIIEATLAVLLIGTTLVAALNVSVAAHRTSANANQRRQAHRLAQFLIAEIMAQPASGVDGTNAAGGSRLGNYDHVTDYEGLRQQPPTDMQGNALASAAWSWGSNIAARSAEMIDGRSLDLRMYEVTVFVEMPGGGRAYLRALRSSSASLDHAPFTTIEQTVRLEATLTLPDGTPVHAAPLVRGQRPPEGAKATMGVPMMRAQGSRRGAAYLIALLAASIVTVTGLAALSMATSRAKASALDDKSAEARLLAASALEHAGGTISALLAEGRVRHDLTPGFGKTVSIGSGVFDWSFTEVTGAAIDNVDGPVFLIANGTSGSARHRVRATLMPSGLPYTCLDTAMYAGGDISIGSVGILNADRVVGAKRNFSNAVGTVSADVEAGDTVSGTLYLGSTTSKAPVREIPSGSSTVDYYRAIGTDISRGSLPDISGARTLQNVLLSPTSNPFGAPNPLGVYVIDVDDKRFHMRNVRVKGTLVLRRSSSDSLIGANVFMQPAHAWMPTLVIDGDVTFAGNGSGPNEASIGVNLNPPGTPYLFQHDGTTDDAYPGRIEGVVYATDDIFFTLLTNRFTGTVVAGDEIRIATGVTVDITYDPGVAHLPPFGFFKDDGGLAIDPASLRWTLP